MLANNGFFIYPEYISCSKRKRINPTPNITTSWEYKDSLEGNTKNRNYSLCCEKTAVVAA